MPINATIATLLTGNDVPAEYLEQGWSLAERSGDDVVMREVLSRDTALPSSILERAKLRKEPSVRIAYLVRPEVSNEERAALLESEKRSAIFAGLVGIADEKPEVLAILLGQLRKKPTKILADALLRGGLKDVDMRYQCLKVLLQGGKTSVWLRDHSHKIIGENTANSERLSEMIEILEIPLLLNLCSAAIKLTPQQALRLLERVETYGSIPHDRWDYEADRCKRRLSNYLLELSELTTLSAEVSAKLYSVAAQDWVTEGEAILHRLANASARLDEHVDELRERGRKATGVSLNKLLASPERHANTPSLLQGLLENKAAWSHPGFQQLLGVVQAPSIVRAMQTLRSPEYLQSVWETLRTETPEACWEYVDNSEIIAGELTTNLLERFDDESRWGTDRRDLAYLLTVGVPDSVVLQLPVSMLQVRRYGTHYYGYSDVLSAVTEQVIALQLRYLGTNSQYWENFNTLIEDWSGTLEELLDACVTI
jgi:hypothetical protein